MIISIHIPKTAGTTLGMFLENGVSHRIIFDYDECILSKSEFIAEHKPLLERFSAIHGHFPYSKYSRVFPDARYITCVRDPVERTISNYLHVMRDKDPSNTLYQRITKNSLDIVEFAQLPVIAKTQCLYLKGRKIEDFDFVGISSDMDTSLKIMSRVLNIPLINPLHFGPFFKTRVPRVNLNFRAWVYSLVGIGKFSQDVRKKIAQAVEPDMELYQRALEQFNRNKLKLGL